MKPNQVSFLTITQVLAIHDRVIKHSGGMPGIRDLRLLDSAVKRPQTEFAGNIMYSTLFDQAAALFQGLVKNHPFLDGNKRTALISAGLFLQFNGWKLINQHQDEVSFAVSVDTEDLSVKEIAVWLRNHSMEPPS